MIDVSAYLRRIDYTGSTEPTLGSLRALHRAHLLAVPFENLDIHLGREIVLDEERLLDKIVRRRRGGFCYELNGLFAALLRQLGFQVTLLSAGVTRGNGSFGPEHDHLLLRVNLDEPWIADVGFGDSFLEPIRLATGEQIDHGHGYRLDPDGDRLVLLARRDGENWSAQHSFTLSPRELSEFAGMCRYHQTSPDTHLTQKRVCSLATPDGRVSLSDDRLIVTSNGQRTERRLDGAAEIREALHSLFGIDLSADEVATAFRPLGVATR